MPDTATTPPPKVITPVRPVGAPPASGPIPPTDEELAHRIHEAFRENNSKVNYETFRDQWLSAAQNVRACSADPAAYVAEFERRIEKLDPEDLVGIGALDRYRMYALKRDRETIHMFNYSVSELQHTLKKEGPDRVRRMIQATGIDMDPVVCVVIAKLWFPGDVEHIIETWDFTLPGDLLASPALRAHITRCYERYGLNGDALLAEIETVLRRKAEPPKKAL